MRNWRVLTAIAAVVLAALAGVLVWKYVDDQKQEAQKPYQQVDVLVANEAHSRGHRVRRARSTRSRSRASERVRKDLPPSYVPGTATDRSLKSSTRSWSPRTTSPQVCRSCRRTSCKPGKCRRRCRRSARDRQREAEGTGQAGDLQAITLTFDDTHAVGGFLTPGDKVNAIVHLRDQGRHRAEQARREDDRLFCCPASRCLAVGAKTSTRRADSEPRRRSSTPATARAAVRAATSRSR